MPKKILVVEDARSHMKLFDDLLSQQGHEIIKSVDGSDAILLATNHEPDLIIMDIRLPGITGFDLIKTLKSDDKLKGIPVIAVTTSALSGDAENILSSGFDDYISKPINVPDFLTTVARHL